jgi:hypothetical protein
MAIRQVTALAFALPAGSVAAAELPPDGRRHPDPVCLERHLDPETRKEKCVVDTGAPRAPWVHTNPDLPPPIPVKPKPPDPGPVYREPGRSPTK